MNNKKKAPAHRTLLINDEQTFILFSPDDVITESAARLSPQNRPVNIVVVIINPRAIIRPA